MTTWKLTREVSDVTTYPKIKHNGKGECSIVTTEVERVDTVLIEVASGEPATTVRVVFLPESKEVQPIDAKSTGTTLDPPNHAGAITWKPVRIAGVTGVAIDFDVPASGKMWGWDFSAPDRPAPLKMKVRVKRC